MGPRTATKINKTHLKSNLNPGAVLQDDFRKPSGTVQLFWGCPRALEVSQALCAAGFGAELPWSPLRGDWLSTAPDLPQPQCSGQCQSQLCLSDHSTADLCPCCLRGAAGTALGMSVPLPPEREGKGLQKFLGHLRQGFESFRVWCQERLTQGSRRNAQLLSSGGRVGVVLKSQPGGFGLLQTPGFLGFLLCSFLCLEQEGEVVGNVCQFPCLWECVPGPAVRRGWRCGGNLLVPP